MLSLRRAYEKNACGDVSWGCKRMVMEEMPGNGYSEEMSCKKSGEETKQLRGISSILHMWGEILQAEDEETNPRTIQCDSNMRKLLIAEENHS